MLLDIVEGRKSIGEVQHDADLLDWFRRSYLDDEGRPNDLARIHADVVSDEGVWQAFENARVESRITSVSWPFRLSTMEQIAAARFRAVIPSVLQAQDGVNAKGGTKLAIAMPFIDPASIAGVGGRRRN